MQINSAMNFVTPIREVDVERPNPEKPNETILVSEALAWAYSAPISTEVFQANYRIIAETNSRIWGKGLKYAATAGARIAALTLLDVAKADAEEYGVEDAGPAFLAEVKRLTTILAPAEGGSGFLPIPVDLAIQRKVIEQVDWDEVESTIVFFTVGYAMSKRAKREEFCELIASRIGGSTTSCTPMEFAASLQTSTADATSAPPAE